MNRQTQQKLQHLRANYTKVVSITDAERQAIIIAWKVRYDQAHQGVIHTPIKPPSRLVPIVRTCVLAIENFINFVKGIFK